MWVNFTSRPEKLSETGFFQANQGTELRVKWKSRLSLGSNVRFMKRSERTSRANSMARKLQRHDAEDFWKEAKMMNDSKTPLPSGVEGFNRE